MILDEIVSRDRRDFPILAENTYLDVARAAPLSTLVADAVRAYLVEAQASPHWVPRWSERIAEFRALAARSIAAAPAQISITRNVSDGLRAVAEAFSWQAGDNVVLASDLEHPNARLVWQRFGEKGVEIRIVPSRHGRTDERAASQALDSRTRVLMASSMLYSTGHRTDLRALSQACRRTGCFFLVDAAQSVGVEALDVEALGIDGLAATACKGLLSIPGCGFLYCDERWRATLRGARERHGFEIGQSNLLPIIASSAALARLLEVGIGNVQSRCRLLATSLREGIVDLRPPFGVDAPDGNLVVLHGPDSVLAHAHAHLLRNNVQASMRDGRLRFSVHYYNDLRDVERAVEVLSQALATGARS